MIPISHLLAHKHSHHTKPDIQQSNYNTNNGKTHRQDGWASQNYYSLTEICPKKNTKKQIAPHRTFESVFESFSLGWNFIAARGNLITIWIILSLTLRELHLSSYGLPFNLWCTSPWNSPIHPWFLCSWQCWLYVVGVPTPILFT